MQVSVAFSKLWKGIRATLPARQQEILFFMQNGDSSFRYKYIALPVEAQLTTFFATGRKDPDFSPGTGMQTGGRWKALNNRFLELV